MLWRQVSHLASDLACRAGLGYAWPGTAPGLLTADWALILHAVLKDRLLLD